MQAYFAIGFNEKCPIGINLSPPVVSRLERALLTGKPSPSLRTLQKYAQAAGKRVQILWV